MACSRNYQKRSRVDRLEQSDNFFFLTLKDQFIENLITIINGGEPKTHSTDEQAAKISTREIADERSTDDSLLRIDVEKAQRFNVNTQNTSPENRNLNQLYFFPPVRGILMAHYDYANKHYGVDIATASNQGIKAILDGTVILSDFTTETGFTIQIQHDHNLVSVYRHNKDLFKKVGDRVKAGEVIATVGNTGELTTGPHLHFEMWHLGRPLNPEHFITFE